MTRYLTIDDALQVLGRFGFHARDAGLLASALARPATTVFGTDAYETLELKAAVLLESLARNHALVDGNKRTAWTLTVLFLWINGYRHDMDTDTAFELVLGVARGELEPADAAEIIRRHLVAR
ncbi:MAG: type II toxin-antitoxin system death-on-curing family toxin [Micrococcales bacterium]|nr:type II toxin-antitoxin system death-on-curing family toxin [Micrococcales bacterium]OJX66181.1 MAG: death-on-curing protein [Micrococcales bacterium 72-143]